MLDSAGACELAGELLGVDSRRWRHSASAARQAELLGSRISAFNAETLTAAAWVHDIGYAGAISATGFHPLDGARFLRNRGEHALACLTAHHSNADVEARHRGLTDELAEFEAPTGPALDALTFCDMTSGPTGARVTFDERLAEILKRYGPEDVIGRSIVEAESSLRAAVERFAHLM